MGIQQEVVPDGPEADGVMKGFRKEVHGPLRPVATRTDGRSRGMLAEAEDVSGGIAKACCHFRRVGADGLRDFADNLVRGNGSVVYQDVHQHVDCDDGVRPGTNGTLTSLTASSMEPSPSFRVFQRKTLW